MIENIINTKNHNNEKYLTSYIASKVDLKITLASIKNGEEIINITTRRYFIVLNNKEILSAATTN